MSVTYRELSTMTGDFMRVQIFPVHSYKYGRAKKSKPSRACQERVNLNNKINMLSDVALLNFSKKDMVLELDFEKYRQNNFGCNPSFDDTRKMVVNFIRRAKRRLAGREIELKYIYELAVGKQGGKAHAHLILTGGLSVDDLRELWQHGGFHQSSLYFEKDGIRGLATYIANQSGGPYRSLSISRNCIRPQKEGKHKCIFENDYKIRQKHVNHIMNEPADFEFIRKMYPGWEVVEEPRIAMVWNDVEEQWELPGFGTFITLRLYKPEGVSSPQEIYDKRHKKEKRMREYGK